MDCYKKLIDVLFDRSTTFSGYDAKYFDKCSRSGDAYVEAQSWNWRDSVQDIVDSGTVNPTSLSFCKNLPLLNSSSNPTTTYVGAAYDTIGNYFYNKYSGSEE